MAYQSIKGGILTGAIYPASNPTIGTGTYNMSASTHKVAFVFVAPRDGTLHSFEIRLGTVTQAPSNGLKFSWQDQNSSGVPDNTVDEFCDVTSGITANAWLTPPNALTDDGTSGGVKRVVSAGDKLAAVIEFVSFNASDNFNFAGLITGDLLGYFGRRSTNSGSTYSVVTNTPIITIRYDDGYEFIAEGIYPATTITGTAFNSGSSPDEISLRFLLPFNSKLLGIRAPLAFASTSATYDIVLYDSASSVVATTTINGGMYANAATSSVPYIPFPDNPIIDANEVHRLSFKPGASNITVRDLTLPSSSYQTALPGGSEFYFSSRTDAGAWTDDDTRRPLVQIYLESIDIPSGGGGGSRNAHVG